MFGYTRALHSTATYAAHEKPFATFEEFIAYYRWMIMLGCIEAWTESVVSQLPKEATIRFTHANLVRIPS